MKKKKLNQSLEPELSKLFLFYLTILSTFTDCGFSANGRKRIMPLDFKPEVGKNPI